MRGGDKVSPSVKPCVNIVSKLDALVESVNLLDGVRVSDPATPFDDKESLLDDDPAEFDPSLALLVARVICQPAGMNVSPPQTFYQVKTFSTKLRSAALIFLPT